MHNIEIAPFYVGQEIIAVKDHSEGIVKKGDEFIVTSISKPCKCKRWLVTVGIFANYDPKTTRFVCYKCNAEYPVDNLEWHFDCSLFAPKIEFTDFIAMKEVTERAMEITSAN